VADIATIVRIEREALAADLQVVDDAAWATASLCSGWTVREVLAHMTALARMTPAKFFQKLFASGFNLARLQSRDITVEKGSSVEETLARFRSVVASKNRLPGQDRTVLGETLVHAEDIRRPLGITHEYPPAALTVVADLYKGSDFITGTKRRVAGLSLRATDVDWSTGSGPEISGPMLSLLMVMAGRHSVIDDLEGEGVETLRSRA
jgi:uncharacterized protein (TIGR03083 family)